jgi:hypothetical protein
MDRYDYTQRKDGFASRSRSAYSSYPVDNRHDGGGGYRRY